MNVLSQSKTLHKIFIFVVCILFFIATVLPPVRVRAAPCTIPTTNYGTGTKSVSVTSAETYRVWARITVPDTTNNSFLLDIDSANCYEVGGGTIPANTLTWVDYQAGTSTNKINTTLTSGSHTLKMIGHKPGVKIDKVMLLSDTSCVPNGNGDNCTTFVADPEPTNLPDLVVESITANPTNPKVGDKVLFSAVVKNQGTVATPTGRHTVRFFVDVDLATRSVDLNTSIPAGGTKTFTATSGVEGTNTWTATEGTYTIEAFTDDLNDTPESDESNNTTTRELVVTDGTVTSKTGDLNGDNNIDIFDLSVLLSQWNRTGTSISGDLNEDGTVNVFDLSILLSKWGQ